nr:MULTISPECIES: 50S ribosomal protein L31 [unclassified Pseudonocardia]
MTARRATHPRGVQMRDGTLIREDVTAFSHPFRTGNTRVLDAAGQVEQFDRRYRARKQG